MVQCSSNYSLVQLTGFLNTPSSTHSSSSGFLQNQTTVSVKETINIKLIQITTKIRRRKRRRWWWRRRNRKLYSNDSTTRTPWNSILKAGEDQVENRTTTRSTVKSLTNNKGGEWKSLLRRTTSKRRLVTTAREWKNPNSRSSCGSSNSHGWSRDSSLRRIMLLKSIVMVSVVVVSWMEWL
jgi:hypothetical protein